MLRKGDLSAIAAPPAAPASPGNLPLPHAPTQEQKNQVSKHRMSTAPSLWNLKRGADGHPALLCPLRSDCGLYLSPLPNAISPLSFQAWCPGAASLRRIL